MTPGYLGPRQPSWLYVTLYLTKRFLATSVDRSHFLKFKEAIKAMPKQLCLGHQSGQQPAWLNLWLSDFVVRQGLRVLQGGVIHKDSLYVDDLLLYISNPSSSIPIIMSILEQFGKFSGYKHSFLLSGRIVGLNTWASSSPNHSLIFSRKLSSHY